MLKSQDVQIRDPFIFPVKQEGKYYMFGSTDKNIWGKGTGFDLYISSDLTNWEGPFPAFRPETDFYSEENFWAPEVHEYQGEYYMFATFLRKDNGCLCHEWVQVEDGEVCAVRLTEDLKEALGEPIILFRASEAPWTTPLVHPKRSSPNNHVTDGTYMYRASNGDMKGSWY
jgi:arabinan endo-1,5-alpha-L-arabinosidase